MKAQQQELLEAAERYEKKMTQTDSRLATGVHMGAHHDWSDVLNEAKLARTYTPRKGSNSIILKNGLRTFETTQTRVEQWLGLLRNSSPCASRLCGGLRMVLSESHTLVGSL